MQPPGFEYSVLYIYLQDLIQLDHPFWGSSHNGADKCESLNQIRSGAHCALTLRMRLLRAVPTSGLTHVSVSLCRDDGLHGQGGPAQVSGAQHASPQPRHAAVHVSPSQTVSRGWNQPQGGAVREFLPVGGKSKS